MQRFRPDREKVLGPFLMALIVWLMMCALVALYFLCTNPKAVTGLPVGMLLFPSPIFILVALIVGLTLSRSVVIGDGGVARTLAGHQFKQLAWDDVTAIYKIRYYDANQQKHQAEFVIMGKSKFVVIDNLIGPTTKVVDTLNSYITKLQIPAFLVDRSLNGRGAQFAAAVLSQSNNGLPVGNEGSKVPSF